jgi:hypothetical protein
LVSPDAKASPHAPVLEYRAPVPEAQPPEPQWVTLGFLLLVSPVAAVPFVSFTWGISPLYVVVEMMKDVSRWNTSEDVLLLGIALPLFLGVAIVAWHVRLLISRRGSAAERVIARSLAALAAGMSAVVAVYALCRTISQREQLQFQAALCSAPAIIAGGVVFWLWARRAVSPETTATIWLLSAYLANAVMCLLLFLGGEEIGWRLTAFGCCVVFGHLLFIFISTIQRRRAMTATAGSSVV